jgi:hypothetical protein
MSTNFPYDEYLNDYPDLRHLNKEEAYQHWLNFGIKEGRKIKEYIENSVPPMINTIINSTTNIVIMIHLFQTELLNEFIRYINNVKLVFTNVIVIFTLSIENNIESTIKNINKDFITLNFENKGVDIYPFIKSIQYLRKNKIKADFILKLHSKMTSNNIEDLLNWRKDLIEPLTNIQNLISLQHYFLSVDNLGFVGAQKCILPKNFDLDFPSNIEGLIQLINKFSYLPKDWSDFNGGNMFWINNNVLDKYLKDDLIQYIISNVCYGKPPSNLTDNGIYIEYLCERLFTGIFCFETTNILINEFNGTERGNSKDYFYQPKVFNFYKPKEIIKYIYK